MSFLFLDLDGVELTAEEKELLQHPAVVGVILFSRNYVSVEQVTALCRSIRQCKPNLLIAVDQEGGRVQRFQKDFVVLPNLALFGKHYEESPARAADLLRSFCYILSNELLAVGVDFSFAPVIDRYDPHSKVIAERAFHRDPRIITALTETYLTATHATGMACVAKHYPGHGSVVADTHHEIAIDPRSLPEIANTDLLPFQQAIAYGLDAVMCGHVIYSTVDEYPAGFSTIWLQDILRKQLQFKGIIFSDDLTMRGAGDGTTIVNRANAALAAGCDVLLICNNRSALINVLDRVPYAATPHTALYSLRAKYSVDWQELHRQSTWKQHLANLHQLEFVGSFTMSGVNH